MNPYGPAPARCYSRRQWWRYGFWDWAYLHCYALALRCLGARNRVVEDSLSGRPYA